MILDGKMIYQDLIRFIKSYDENNNKGYFLKVDVEYPKKLFGSHKDLPFLPERKKIRK